MRRQRTVTFQGQVPAKDARAPDEMVQDLRLEASRVEERRLHDERTKQVTPADVRVDEDGRSVCPGPFAWRDARHVDRPARDGRHQQTEPSEINGSPGVVSAVPTAET